jgi:hypothetical protein
MTNHPRTLLVLLDGRGLSTYPAVYQTAAELKRRGIGVTLLTGASCDDPDLRQHFDDIVVRRTRGPGEAASCVQFIARHEAKCVVAFEPSDAFKCALAAPLRRDRCNVYFNLEVYEPTSGRNDLRNLAGRCKKRLERFFVENCAAMVIQDDLRKRLSRRFGISHECTFLIPNSYTARDISPADAPAGKAVSLLYPGSVEQWSIGSLVSRLPALLTQNMRLTFSGWSRDGYIDTVRRTLASCPGVTFAEQKLTTAEYDCLVDSHDIGLIWYDTLSDNVTNIGRSSGKFFKFLSRCKPVIVRDLPGLADDVRQFGLGVVIADLGELPAAVATISDNYRAYTHRIADVYRSVFDFSVASRPFFDWLQHRLFSGT